MQNIDFTFLAIRDSGRIPAGIYIWRIVTDGREGGAGKIIVGR
jgi:hypothetical protein